MSRARRRMKLAFDNYCSSSSCSQRSEKNTEKQNNAALDLSQNVEQKGGRSRDPTSLADRSTLGVRCWPMPLDAPGQSSLVQEGGGLALLGASLHMPINSNSSALAGPLQTPQGKPLFDRRKCFSDDTCLIRFKCALRN